jgi:hypothetical protein
MQSMQMQTSFKGRFSAGCPDAGHRHRCSPPLHSRDRRAAECRRMSIYSRQTWTRCELLTTLSRGVTLQHPKVNFLHDKHVQMLSYICCTLLHPAHP